MRFKTVKVPGHYGYGDFSNYELSEDGKIVRNISTKEVIAQSSTGRTIGVVLLNTEGKDRVLGVPSLYRWTYYKAIPTTAAVSSPKKKVKTVEPVVKEKKAKKADKAAKPTSGRKRKGKSILVAGKTELMSLNAKSELQQGVLRRRGLGSTGASVEVYEHKGSSIRVVFDNVKKNIGIIHIDDPKTWRNGYWFFNYEAGTYVKFSDEEHRRDGKYGDENIIWPKI